MTKKNIVVTIVVCLISLLIGFIIGQGLERGVEQTETVSNQQEELDWLKSQLEVFYPPLPEEIYRIFGTVAQIQDDFLVMESNVRVSQFPLPEGKDIERQNIKVNISGKTEVFRLKLLSEPLFLEGQPPELFEKIALSFEEIKIGDPITVITEENIKGEKEITAKEIQIDF